MLTKSQVGSANPKISLKISDVGRTNELKHSKDHGPFWEANSSLASQEITCIIQSPKVHYRIHKSLLLVPIQSWLKPGRYSLPISLWSILILYSHLLPLVLPTLLFIPPSHTSYVCNVMHVTFLLLMLCAFSIESLHIVHIVHISLIISLYVM